MSKGNYSLRTVRDFLEIPDDKIGDCLYDFAAWLQMVKLAEASIHVAMVRNSDTFGWVDDGKHIATVTMRGPDGTSLMRLDLSADAASRPNGDEEGERAPESLDLSHLKRLERASRTPKSNEVECDHPRQTCADVGCPNERAPESATKEEI